MQIRAIELTNFRVFEGKQTIDFSTDSKKNVTVVMGDNGSGKTTLAQAFSWCLYGTTTFKKNDELLSLSVMEKMGVGDEESVSVRITLEHNGREYRINRTQSYKEEAEGKPPKARPSVLSISKKETGGQDEPILEESAKKDLINEIVPAEISSYFFFDGERVEKMGKEIQDGNSKEFKVAVENLLGLSALSSALKHLKGGSSSVISSYNRDFNKNSDKEYQAAVAKIEAAENRIEELENSISGLKEEKTSLKIARDRYDEELKALTETKALADERTELEVSIETLEKEKEKYSKALLEKFGKSAWGFFSAPLFDAAIHELEESDLEIKDAPAGVCKDTIEDLIEQGVCLCGTTITGNTDVLKHLTHWLSFVPPEHLGAAVSHYKDDCTISTATGPELRGDIEFYLQETRKRDADIDAARERIDGISKQLENAKDSSSLEQQLSAVKKRMREIDEDISEMTMSIGSAKQQKQAAEAEKNKLSVNDDTNKRVQLEKDYADYIYSVLYSEHSKQEEITRNDLEKEINSIFQEFFDGVYTLELDDHYNVNVKSTGANYDIETSEGQTVAVIFAFIASVIRLATDSKRTEDEMLLTEAYPLLMDAPMSKLDKKRIEAICEVVPKIAEQTIVLIKDTDGELARDYLKPRIGVEYAIVNLGDHRSSIEKR